MARPDVKLESHRRDEMSHYRWTIALAALLLAACGGATQPAQQAVAPTAAAPAATVAPAATTAPAAAPTSEPTSAPAATAAPTEPLILPPTQKPAEGVQAPSPVAAQPATPRPAPKPASAPARLVIEDIGVDYRPVTVGLDKNRVPVVPEHDVGWYKYSAGPGEGENIVLWGHVLRFRNAPKIPAPFARLKELQPGAAIVLYDRAGTAHSYVIKQQVWATPDQVEYILPQGRELVTMVSCIGDKVISNGEVVDESHRLITIAEPAA